jgi:hypothetical protein
MGTLRVVLNGTDTNHWHKYNLRQNPFPQIAKFELDHAMRQLNSLDGDPLQGPDDIRSRLDGWSDEFIQGCIERFEPGKRVRFEVQHPDL